MRLASCSLIAAALVTSSNAQQNGNYCDELGRCYASHTTRDGVTFGVAIPKTTATDFDLIFQITASSKIGWAGLAWGGAMSYNPLSVVWPNGENTVVSSRASYSYTLPLAYENSTLTVIDGSYVNETHWVVTAFCQGCAKWTDLASSSADHLDPTADNSLGFVYSKSAVDSPEDENSTFARHDYASLVTINFSTAQSANFASWVPKVSRRAHPRNAAAIPTTCNLQSSLPLQAAQGWSFVKVAGGLTNPRGLAIDSKGNLLVVEVGKGLSVHTFGSNGCISSSKILVNNPRLTHGIALSPDSSQLFISSIDTVWKFNYDAAAQTTSNQQTVVSGMFPGTHTTRTLLVPPKTPKLLIVSHGSNGNLDMATADKRVGRALVKVFNMSNVPGNGYTYSSSGSFLGYGLRNEVAIAADKNNMIWGVENSGDDFSRTVNGVTYDIHNDNPAEEINYLGDPSVSNEKWYGYPTCFTVWGGDQFPDGKPATGSQFLPAPNATFNDASCEQQSVAPRLSLPAHTAPMDAKFDREGTNLLVSLHGSWNRNVPAGFKVVTVPFTTVNGNYEPVAAANSRDGFKDVLWDPQQGCNSSKCFRPCGLIFDADFTRLFVSSDSTREGEIYILSKNQ